ncbi:MAG: TetR/AcrR family transcriptional regulator [Clostridia bacterium]|nr:TetR/AcrR family transcriptional regulator [Clostridia bacterium]
MPRRKDFVVVEQLENAIFNLLKEKEYKDISISELCDKAWVSRCTFYRNYKSMDDIIYQYFMRESQIWWDENYNLFLKEENYISLSLFKYLLSLKERIIIVYQRGLSYIFEKHIFDSAINGRDIFDKEQSYSSARVSGAIVGLTNEWVRRGMQDSPEYLAKFLNKEIEYRTI